MIWLKVRIHWSLFLFSLAYFLSGLLIEMGLFFIFVLLHEFAHIVVAKGYGIKVEKTVIYPFGGRAYIDELIEEDPEKELHIAIAGPLVNVLLAVLIAAAQQNPDFILSQEQAHFAIRANLILAVLNLLPGLPLDGGRILRALLNKKFSFPEASHYTCYGGKIVGLLLSITGLYYGIFWQYYNISFFIVGIFIFFAASREAKDISYLYFRHLTRKKRLLQQQGVMACQILMAFDDTTINEVTNLFQPKKYHILHVIDSNWHKKAIVEEIEIIDALLKRGGNEKLSKLL